jgi:hypothetical protein
MCIQSADFVHVNEAGAHNYHIAPAPAQGRPGPAAIGWSWPGLPAASVSDPSCPPQAAHPASGPVDHAFVSSAGLSRTIRAEREV